MWAAHTAAPLQLFSIRSLLCAATIHVGGRLRNAIKSTMRLRDAVPVIESRSRRPQEGYRFHMKRIELPYPPKLTFLLHGYALFVHGCFRNARAYR